jgi:RNA polymerase sigma-70 factor (ECF subfamily)
MNPIRDLLRRHYLLSYNEMKSRLTQRLGSADLAGDALQDTWLRLENAASIGPVDRPFPYLLRIAYNFALQHARREQRMVTIDEARDALSLVDDSPGPEQIWGARAELTMLKDAMKELTPRRRDILLASRLEGIAMHEIAARHGISQRMAERELKRALEHCSVRLGRKVIQRFGPRPRQDSHEGGDE